VGPASPGGALTGKARATRLSAIRLARPFGPWCFVAIGALAARFLVASPVAAATLMAAAVVASTSALYTVLWRKADFELDQLVPFFLGSVSIRYG